MTQLPHTQPKAPPRVLEAIEIVRRTGVTNMFHIETVKRACVMVGYPSAARWIEKHRKEYATGVIRGFEIKQKEVQHHNS